MASAPDRRKGSAYVLRRDASQIGIPANRAMRVQSIAQPHHARVEARAASHATPGVDTKNAQNIVRGGLPARTPRAKMFADGADHLSDRVLPWFSKFWHSIGQCVDLGKRLKVTGNRVQ